MILTVAQSPRLQKLSERSERLARHAANCESLTAAYVRRRQRDARMIRADLDALLQRETMAPELWTEDFDAEQFLDLLPAHCKRRYRLS
jgi:hypothetical protein